MVADASGSHPLAENADFKKLTGSGMNPKVAELLVPIFESGMMSHDDLEEKTYDALRSLKVDEATTILKQFSEADLIGVTNPASFLGVTIRMFRSRIRQQGAETALTVPVIRAPDSAKLQEILDRTGYSLEVTAGQRKYGGPPPDWDGPAPSGCECYVGNIPRELFEDDLIPLFEEIGKIWDLRLMMDPFSNHNKGYGFVTYTTKEDTQAAAKKYDDHEIKPGKRLKVNVSIANTRLFVGNIPKSKSKEEIMEEMSSLSEGLVDVIVYALPDDTSAKNRGFAFLDYEDHKTGSDAKRKLSQGRTRPFGRDVVVDWAQPETEVNEDTMKEVKVLYVKGLKQAVTEEKLKPDFEAFGEIESIKRMKDYAFVHYNERASALNAMAALDGKEYEGVAISVVLAKPMVEGKKKPGMRYQNFGYQDGGRGMRGGRGRVFRGGPRGPRGGFGGGGFGFAPRGGRGRGFGFGGGPPPPPAGYYGAEDFGMGGYDDYSFGGGYGSAYDWGYGYDDFSAGGFGYGFDDFGFGDGYAAGAGGIGGYAGGMGGGAGFGMGGAFGAGARGMRSRGGARGGVMGMKRPFGGDYGGGAAKRFRM